MKKRIVAILLVSFLLIRPAEINLSKLDRMITDLDKATDGDDTEEFTIGSIIDGGSEDSEDETAIEQFEEEITSPISSEAEMVETEEQDDGLEVVSESTSDEVYIPANQSASDSEMEDDMDDEEALASALEEISSSPDDSSELLPTVDEEEVEEDDDIVTLTEPKREVDSSPILMSDELSFDLVQKRQDVIDLVAMARKELEQKPLDVACNRFSHTKEFIKGDLYVFVYDINGTCIAHGDDSHLIWKNLYDLKDWVGTPIVQDLIKTAKSGGGWVTYGWHNATKVAYVEFVEKDGKQYVVGSGYFPHSKEEAVVNLVKGGVALFNKMKQEGHAADWAFSRMSYPSGAFVAGNLYLYALDFKGNIKAQGERPGLIGSNAWNYRDSNGKYVNREIVKKLKNTTKGVWVEYISKRAPKKAYAEKVTDKKGRQYFIACGYYPDANREKTMDLVRKAYQFMKTHGKSNSVDEFSARRSDDFRYGDLAIVVYDMKGKIIADGTNADNIGRRVMDVEDEDGIPYIRNVLKKATKQGIWVNAKVKGSFQSTFAQKIDLGVGQYVIASSYYPVSKSETMILLVQSASSFLRSNRREVAFEQFVQTNGKFRRGDLELVVIDTSGLCYVYGNDYDLIWRNIFNIKDERGRSFIKLFINESQQGPVVVKTSMNNATKYNYVSSIEKEGKTYVVSSGYYQ